MSHGDDLAELLRADEIAVARAAFRQELRAELVSRPPAGTLPNRTLPLRRLGATVFVVAAIAIVALLRVGPSSLLRQGDAPLGAGNATTRAASPAAATPTTRAAPLAGAVDRGPSPTASGRPADGRATEPGLDSADRSPAAAPTKLHAVPMPTGAQPEAVVAAEPTSPPASDAPSVPEPPDVAPTAPDVAPTPTDADVPPYTPVPGPSSTPTTPAPTDTTRPSLPATPTAAPTNAGLPTAIPPETPGPSASRRRDIGSRTPQNGAGPAGATRP